MPLPDFIPAARAGTLWMCIMPGLDAEVLKQSALKIGLMWHGQMVNLSPEQWVAFERACRELIGLSPSWKEDAYTECYKAAKVEGWGTKYGPGSPGGWKRKQKPSDETINIQGAQSLEGTLFE